MVGNNVGKLAKWLRMTGYNTTSLSGSDDSGMIAIARVEDGVIFTRDTRIAKRRLITSGRLRTILITSNEAEGQIKQAKEVLNLNLRFRMSSICLECNQLLVKSSREQVEERVLPYVFKSKHKYMECPTCHHIYWRETYWRAMSCRLYRLMEG